jgi:hypothetical protein
MLGQVSVSFVTSVARTTALSALKQIEKPLENISSLKKHFYWEVLNDIVAQSLRSDHHCAEVTELQLNRQVEQPFLVLLIEPNEG